MIQGAGTILNYGSYISNCTKGQMPYKIPINNLQDVQLYIAVGVTKPDAVQYQLIHTCGAFAGTVESLTTASYIVGQDYNNQWYGVFKNFDSTVNPLTCFVIAITLVFAESESIYFSEEYCVDNNCGEPLTLLKGCYGNLDSRISYDCNGVYFGAHAGADFAMGIETITYQHQAFLRGVEVSLSSIKNTFRQGRTRTFRTEKERLYQFYAELIPEWYMPEIDAIFYRGEVFVGAVKYLVNELQLEKIEDCKKQWKVAATFKESCYQSFSCEADPCAAPVFECCNPTSLFATVQYVDDTVTCCNPEIINAYVDYES